MVAFMRKPKEGRFDEDRQQYYRRPPISGDFVEVVQDAKKRLCYPPQKTVVNSHVQIFWDFCERNLIFGPRIETEGPSPGFQRRDLFRRSNGSKYIGVVRWT